MKKVLALLLAMVLVLSLAACGGGSSSNGESSSVESQVETTEAITEAPPSDAELCAEYAVEKLKDILKNPSSLVVNKLHAVQDGSDYVFEIDYTAENGFGGSNRDTFYVSVSKSGDGFATHSLGSTNYADSTSQRYTGQLYQQNLSSGYLDFDTTTYRIK